VIRFYKIKKALSYLSRPGLIIQRLSYQADRWRTTQLLDKCQKCGDRVVIEPPCRITWPHRLSIGDDVVVKSGAFLQARGGLTIGSHIIAAEGLKVLTSNHDFEMPDVLPYGTGFKDKPVVIEDYVWLGMNVTLLPGVRVGQGAIVGAAAVVTEDIPPLAIAGGNPAKIHRYRDKAGFEAARKRRVTLSDIRGGAEMDGIPIKKLFMQNRAYFQSLLDKKQFIGPDDLASFKLPERYLPAMVYLVAQELNAYFVWDSDLETFIARVEIV
jgi:acetyltransferase-like isoleucine patch superfamily enzyme